MQEKLQNSKPPGLCRRLLRYITSGLSPQRSKNETHSLHVSEKFSTKVATEAGSSRSAEKSHFGHSKKPNFDSDLGSEIVVQFRHLDELENLTDHANIVRKQDFRDQIAMQKGMDTKERRLAESVIARKQDGRDQISMQKGVNTKERRRADRAIDRKDDRIDQILMQKEVDKKERIRPQRAVDRKEDGRNQILVQKGEDTKERKRSISVQNSGKSTIDKKSDSEDQTGMVMVNEGEETKVRFPGRSSRHIGRVISNINEKSEAFIRSRKEAMMRNYNLDSEN